MRHYPLVLVRCARCGFPAPVEDDELTSDGGGDPDLDIDIVIVIVPPPGWIADPGSDELPATDGIIHRGCAFPHERAEADELDAAAAWTSASLYADEVGADDGLRAETDELLGGE